MYKIDFNKPLHVHFIGIGGISMSGIAQILVNKGFTVSGSDAKESDLTHKLESLGCNVIYSQTAANITPDIDLVVYTAAISKENPELVAARQAGIPTETRADLLGEIMKNYKTAINVAGTHGKTTTTSMIASVLLSADTDPTISVGGILDRIGGNIRVGQSDLFLTEACEYTNSFLSFFPTMDIILNVKADHLDFFKDLEDIRHSFRKFAEKLPASGTLIINTDIEDYQYFCKDLPCEIITVGSDPARSMYSASSIQFDEKGCCSYTLLIEGKEADKIQLHVPGIHNVYNSLAAIAATMRIGLSLPQIRAGLESFYGTERRFERKGVFHGVTVIDDYAHHPDEIRATLSTAAHYPHKSIWCVFQPHTYTRTKFLLHDFAAALAAGADHIVLGKIYAAREKNTIGISSADLMREIQKLGTDCHYFEEFSDIETFLSENCVNGDLLITMGAGDIYKVGEDLLK